MDSFGLLILFFVIASTLQHLLLQARSQAMQRARQIAAIEKERNGPSPRNELVFSVPVSRMIDLEDAQQIIPAIRMVG